MIKRTAIATLASVNREIARTWDTHYRDGMWDTDDDRIAWHEAIDRQYALKQEIVETFGIGQAFAIFSAAEKQAGKQGARPTRKHDGPRHTISAARIFAISAFAAALFALTLAAPAAAEERPTLHLSGPDAGIVIDGHPVQFEYLGFYLLHRNDPRLAVWEDGSVALVDEDTGRIISPDGSVFPLLPQHHREGR